MEEILMSVLRFILETVFGVDLSGSSVEVTLSIIHVLLGVLGVTMSAAGFVIPCFTTIADIVSEGSVGQRSSLPYATGLINCVLWTIYGHSARGSRLIISVNLLGAVCMLYCLCTYLQHCDQQEFELGLVCPLAGGVAMICVMFLYFSDRENRLFFLCWTCALTRGLVALVPLTNLGVVQRQKNMGSMPSPLLSTVSLLAAVFWGSFACTAGFDGFILWPSVAGFLSAAAQVALHLTLREPAVVPAAQAALHAPLVLV